MLYKVLLPVFVSSNLLLSGCTSSSSSRITGTLDTKFGANGIAAYSDATNSTFQDVIRDDAGNYIVAGSHNQNAAVWRYSSDGVLDTSFGTNGMVEQDGGGTLEGVNQLILQSDGKILAIGTSQDGANIRYMTIWCFTSTGALDNTFGTNGIVQYTRGGAFDLGYYGIIDSNNKIVVTGISNNGGNDMAIWRFDINGAPDITFGTNGLVLDGTKLTSDHGAFITENADGTYLIAGSGNSDAVTWKYQSNGSPDLTYGTNGITQYDNGGYDALYRGILDANGTLTITGVSNNGVDHDMVILQYDSSGALLTGFGTAGIVRYDGGLGYDGGQALTIDGAGRILVVGQSDNATDRDMMLWRYKPNGTLDSSFGTGGVVFYDQGTATNEAGYGITRDNAGRIIVAGSLTNSTDATTDGVLWRYK